MLSAYQHLLRAPPSTTMGRAVACAVKGFARTSPNPAVGCVVVCVDGVVVTGTTEAAGKRHAEITALDQLAPGQAKGATVFTTLEPCSHHGRTPPCVDRLIREGVARVVVGAVDPNPVVNGRGLQKLRDAGIVVDVVAGADADWCAAILQPFAVTQTQQRPYVVLKVATSLDGKIATTTGSSRWITGPESRALVHRLRDVVDGVVSGSGTVVADDPAFTVRGIDGGHDPLRVILDRRRRVPVTAKVFADNNVLIVDDSDDVAMVLRRLQQRGLTSVLVEAGPGVASAFVAAGVVDEVWWFAAPVVIGGDGVAVFAALGVVDVNAAVKFDVVDRAVCGNDALTILRPALLRQSSTLSPQW